MEFTALTLATCLFELEGESIYNDPDSHWMCHGWFDKYGEDSTKHKDFSYPEAEVKRLADIMTEDYSNNVLDSFEYDPYTSDMYAGFITNCFEKQLAVKTGVGYQLNF
jgi:hypothetical protein